MIGVTGTYGKSTTASLIYEILYQSGKKCYLGGNIGKTLFNKIGEMKQDDYMVLELSSFQLINMKVSPKISVITNIFPDNLGIHRSYNEYIDTLSNIFKYQDNTGLLIANYDNEVTRKFAQYFRGRVIYFSSKEKISNGVIFDEDTIKISENGLRRHLISSKSINLKEIYNYENICAAIAATSSIVQIEDQVRAIKNFKKLQ